MAWSAPVDIYCERMDTTFWAEPVNALTNVGFLAAAAFAYVAWRNAGRHDLPVLSLIVVVGLIGFGSFAFHTVATRGAALLDVIPISIFIYGYLLLALGRLLGLNWSVSVVLVIGFALLTVAVGQALPAGFLNGSGNYLPVLAALIAVGWLIRNNRQRRLALAAAGVFAVSLIFRTIDHAVCTAFPLGTHFLWHVLNALVLYLLLRATMMGGKVGNQDPPYSQAMPS